MKTYVLDACALIAYLNDEEGSENIENILLDNNICFMSIINVFEVCYIHPLCLNLICNTWNSKLSILSRQMCFETHTIGLFLSKFFFDWFWAMINTFPFQIGQSDLKK